MQAPHARDTDAGDGMHNSLYTRLGAGRMGPSVVRATRHHLTPQVLLQNSAQLWCQMSWGWDPDHTTRPSLLLTLGMSCRGYPLITSIRTERRSHTDICCSRTTASDELHLPRLSPETSYWHLHRTRLPGPPASSVKKPVSK